jgi:phospholipid N-methyltransferase
MIDELRNVDIEGFFPTPDAVIDMMLAAADMHDGQTVLEPSAGIGSICDRVKQAFPHTDLDAVELRDSLARILVAKGHAVVGRDFTAWNGNGRQYDRVLMNPLFEKGADMAHVRQAFNHVKPGGRLVAIMSNGFRFRQTSRATGFRAWPEEMDGDVTNLPEDAFNGSNAFRRTGVKAVIRIGSRLSSIRTPSIGSKHNSHGGKETRLREADGNICSPACVGAETATRPCKVSGRRLRLTAVTCTTPAAGRLAITTRSRRHR